MWKSTICLAITFALVSCKEDIGSADSLMLEEERAKLVAIEKELAEVRIKAKEIKTEAPQTPVADLEKKLATAREELKTLNGKFGELEKSHKEVTRKLEDYQEKYPIR